MNEGRTTLRVVDVTDPLLDEGWLHPTCLKCGKVLTLHFNGGELDRTECCGLRYSLEHASINLVISQTGPAVK